MGRWAKQRGLPRTAGHAAGGGDFPPGGTYARDIGLEFLTVYAFSTENWKRPAEEVSTIMGLLERYLHEAIAKMERDRVKMRFFGDTTVLSPKLQELIARTAEISTRFEGCQVNICVNYGGRGEILRAARAYGVACARGEAPELTEEAFRRLPLLRGRTGSGSPHPPGREMRISNFLLWQAAYAEFYFTDVLWPDFTPAELDKAIAAFQGRSRRYGGLMQ